MDIHVHRGASVLKDREKDRYERMIRVKPTLSKNNYPKLGSREKQKKHYS